MTYYKATSAGNVLMTEEEVTQLLADRAAAGAPVVPVSVSPRQIRQALTASGLRAAVEAAVAAGDQNLKDWWEFSTAVERNNPEVAAMAASLGVTAAQLDALFTLAYSL